MINIPKCGIAEVMGKPYEDASGNQYLEMFRQPVIITTGDGNAIAAAHKRALSRGMPMVFFSEEMLDTNNDDDNRAVVRPVAAEDMRLVGLAAYGPRNAIDKVFNGLSLHP